MPINQPNRLSTNVWPLYPAAMGWGNRLKSIQVLRFVAAFGVVTAHTVGTYSELINRHIDIWAGPLSQAGVIGVDIFFLISGFVIYGVAFGKQGATSSRFLRDRVIRVVPIYYLASIAWTPVAWSRDMLHWRNLFTTLTFWPALDKLSAPIAEVGWTLCFEMLFYSAVALILWRRPLAFLMIAIFAAAWIGRDLTQLAVLQFIGNPIILEFLAGMLIAALWGRWSNCTRVGVASLGAGVTIYVLSCLVGYGPVHDGHFIFNGAASALRVVLFGIPAALIMFGALQCERFFRGKFFDSLSYLGDTSYSLYLIHIPVLLAIGSMGTSIHVLSSWYYFVLPPVCIVAGILCHEAIEKPLIAFFRRPKLKPAVVPA